MGKENPGKNPPKVAQARSASGSRRRRPRSTRPSNEGSSTGSSATAPLGSQPTAVDHGSTTESRRPSFHSRAAFRPAQRTYWSSCGRSHRPGNPLTWSVGPHSPAGPLRVPPRTWLRKVGSRPSPLTCLFSWTVALRGARGSPAGAAEQIGGRAGDSAARTVGTFSHPRFVRAAPEPSPPKSALPSSTHACFRELPDPRP